MIENTVVGTDSKENQQLKTCYDHIFYVGWFNRFNANKYNKRK